MTMKKALALAAILLLPAAILPARASASCTQLTGGLNLAIPTFDDDGDVWGACMVTAFTRINNFAAVIGTFSSVNFSTVIITQNGISSAAYAAGYYPSAPLIMVANTNAVLQAVLQNLSNGTAATSDIVLTNDLGSNTSYYLDIFMNSSKYSQAGYTAEKSSASGIASSDSDIMIWAGVNGGLYGAKSESVIIGSSSPVTANIAAVFQPATGTGPGALTVFSSATFNGLVNGFKSSSSTIILDGAPTDHNLQIMNASGKNWLSMYNGNTKVWSLSNTSGDLQFYAEGGATSKGLVMKNATGFVGIGGPGTNGVNPATMLHVTSGTETIDGNVAISLNASGNIITATGLTAATGTFTTSASFGTSTGAGVLHVSSGLAVFDGTASDHNIEIYGASGKNYISLYGGTTKRWSWGNLNSSGDLQLYAEGGASNVLKIVNASGFFGLMTDGTPSYKFHMSSGTLYVDGNTAAILTTGTVTGSKFIGGLLAQGSSGGIQIATGTSIGAPATTAIVWDWTNSRLGLGSANPSGILHVSSGIAIFDGNPSDHAIAIYAANNNNYISMYSATTKKWSMANLNSGDLQFYNEGGHANTLILQDSTGNIGLSNLKPATQLHGSSGTWTLDGTTPKLIIGSNASGTGTLVTYGIVTSSSASPTFACNAGTPVPLATVTNGHGTFAAGTAAANCTVTFSVAWPKTPDCICSDDSSLVAVRASAVSTTALTCAGTTISGDNISYICLGAP